MEYIVVIAAILYSLFFSYSAGKKVEKSKQQEELIEVITNAKKARAKLSDADYVKWLRSRNS